MKFIESLIIAIIWVGVICAGAVFGGKMLLGAWTDGQRALIVAQAQAKAIGADKDAANKQATSCSHEIVIRTQAQHVIDTMKAAPPQPGGIFGDDQIGKVFGDAR